MKPIEKTKLGTGAVPSRRVWAPEVRVRMAQMVVEHGIASAVVAQSFGIPVTTVMDWAHRYRKDGAEALQGSGMGARSGGRAAAAKGGTQVRRQAVVRAKREHPEQGSRKIRDLLARFEGLGISETTVRRVLHEEGLLEVRPEKVAKPRGEEPRFERAEPNQLWQSDIFTFLLRRHERLYVTAFLDDYSRYLVSLVVAHHQKSALVMEALQRGIAEYGAPREILTDQGRQYTAWRGTTEFEEELRRQGIRHIKSRPHHPQTLGKTERFWKTLWDEFLSRTVFADFADCERRIALFVQAYNFKRPHQGIGGAVPADRFFRAAPQVRQAIEGQVAANALALARERPSRPPFYLVGRLGDQDLSIALSGRGLLIRLGGKEQVIGVFKEDEDDETAAARRVTEKKGAAGAEVALEGGGAGPAGAGEMPSDLERFVGGEAGERCDRGGGDLAGEVLPTGDPGPERDASGSGAGILVGGGPGEPAEADRGLGGQGEGPSAVAAEGGEAAAHDPAGDEGTGEENSLDPQWQDSFAKLEDEEVGAAAGFDEGGDWRGRALTWERKLAGEEESHGQELQAPAGDSARDAGEVPGDGGGLVGEAHGEGGGLVPESLPEPVSEPPAPGSGGTLGWDLDPSGRPAGGAGAPEAPGGAEGGSGEGERAAAPAGGDDGAPAGAGERPSAGAGADEDPVGEDEIGG